MHKATMACCYDLNGYVQNRHPMFRECEFLVLNWNVKCFLATNFLSILLTGRSQFV
jgi:hypothetical protein